jgi:peptide/nickel transport system substrate-binding protein
MSNRLWMSIALAAIGAGLLVAAASAGRSAPAAPAKSAAAQKTGGTFVAELSTDVDYVDPALDYLSSGWEIQYALACKLMNYPDKNGPQATQLTPEVAAGLPRISNGGRTYTFTVKPGFRFANGEAVTAKSFADAFNRDANPHLQSPAQAFMTDLVGANDVLNGHGSQISGIRVKGNTIAFTLVKPSPDFLARLTMPFFQAIPRELATNVDPAGANVIHSCGPYYVSARTPNQSITIKRNPYYKGSRPHNFNEFDYKIGNSLQVIQQNVESNHTDYAAQGIPPTSYAQEAAKYGVNKSRFWVEPLLSVSYLAMNTQQPLFKDNPQLRKAVANAIDRRALLNQSGFLAGKRTDHILPPGLVGVKPCNCYSLKGANIALAKKLAAGNTRGGKAILWTANRSPYPERAQIYQYDLAQIGIQVEIQQYARAVQITREGTRGSQFDLTDEGWNADYADPYDFINVLLDGTNIQDANNNDISYFNDPTYNKKIQQAARLSGDARYAAYANLDLDITRNAVPIAPRANSTWRVFLSNRVGCFVFNPNYEVDLAALCLT